MVLNIWEDINNKKIAPIYVLYGKEQFFINETKQLLVKNVLDGETDFNLSTYDLEETPIEVAIEDAETLPFMGEKRLIFLDNPYFLTSEKTKEKVEHNLKRLEEYIIEPSPYSVIVFSCPYEKLDERKKITKELKRKGVVLEAKKLNERDLKVWLKKRAKMQGVSIHDDALEHMIALAGDHLFLLISELDKLALYAGEGQVIDMEMVQLLVSRTLEQNIFDLVDNIIDRKIEEALRIYYDLLKQNEEPIKILSIIAGQFRLIYQVKELMKRGYGQQQIAKILKVHPYRVKVAAGQGKKFSDKELVRVMDILADADYQSKSGGNKELLIELFLFQLKDVVKM